MRAAAFVLFSLLLPDPAAARDWKVIDTAKDPRAPEARLLLRIEKSAISVIREGDKIVLLEIAPAEVMAIWYDDHAVRNYGREWFEKMDELCRDLCGGEDITMPLTLMAVGGVGYLAARPFEDRRHYANIQYRRGDSFDVITLGTTWLDHVWLMTDLSQAVGKRWLNIPLQRAKLFWSWTDRTQVFEAGSYAGKVPLKDQQYNVLLWEDGKGRGILMFFSAQASGTPALLAAEAVTVEKVRSYHAEYCRSTDEVQQVLRVQVGDKRATLSSATRACTGSPRQ
jgi:hypothetical protein